MASSRARRTPSRTDRMRYRRISIGNWWTIVYRVLLDSSGFINWCRKEKSKMKHIAPKAHGGVEENIYLTSMDYWYAVSKSQKLNQSQIKIFSPRNNWMGRQWRWKRRMSGQGTWTALLSSRTFFESVARKISSKTQVRYSSKLWRVGQGFALLWMRLQLASQLQGARASSRANYTSLIVSREIARIAFKLYSF